jgi:(1->4)-alpha-D-glucan 1-alpha-D-glucosylmutase
MPPPSQPASTYRLQLGSAFTFRDARALVPYLASLGVTHAYSSPLLRSRPGSTHGYDIVDHRTLDPALGSQADFDAWVGTLAGHDMGLIADIVPNHMGLDITENRWWRDVLAHGPASIYAAFFDIDWAPLAPELQGRILLPILQDAYGDVLHRGELTVAWNGDALVVCYGALSLPLELRSWLRVLGEPRLLVSQTPEDSGAREYAALIDGLEQLPLFTTRNAADLRRRREDAGAIERRFADLAARSARVREHVNDAVARINGVAFHAETFDRLHELLEAQPYRLAHWRTAFDDINYRRFFDVNDLGGLCMENPRVFEETHALILELVGRGALSGLRIDHPDGLFDPTAYFARLQEAGGMQLPPGQDAAPLFVVAEKILATNEVLPDRWQIAGTTGYGFLACVNGQFVKQANERLIRDIYARLTRGAPPFERVAYDAKHAIMRHSRASELAVLTRAMKAIASADRLTRDFTSNVLRAALIEVVACFPVYRTYIDRQPIAAVDRQSIDIAIDRARQRNRSIPPSTFIFVRRVLLGGDREDGRPIDEAQLTFAMKFQQFTAPVQAKGVEDTAFYRDSTLLSLNEVGGDPAKFGHSVEELHEGNRVRLERWPLELIATSTHDTKRGEDARARLNVLSEIPQRWRREVSRWMRMNSVLRTAVDREPAPDRCDEYLFYQSLLGVWPAETADAPIPPRVPDVLLDRVLPFMQKAIKEAKVHTSWVNPNPAYEDAVETFVRSALGGPADDFRRAFIPFARWLALRGASNSLSQLVLKLASPGVSDFYQGSELWTLDLADPDNRRPVDFAARQSMLDTLQPWIARAEVMDGTGADAALERAVAGWLAAWPDGRIKMFVTACGLRLRRRHADLFLHGSYQALHVEEDERIVALTRQRGGRALIAIAPRFAADSAGGWAVGAEVWGDARLRLPESLDGRRFRHVLTGAQVIANGEAGRAWLALDDVLRTCPVAILWSDSVS